MYIPSQHPLCVSLSLRRGPRVFSEKLDSQTQRIIDTVVVKRAWKPLMYF